MSFQASGNSNEAPDKPTLQLLLFGSPAAAWRGAPLRIDRRQVRALLYRLAAEGRPVAREQLCFLFWSDVPELAARRALTSLLSHLQRALPSAVHLLVDGDSVALDTSNISIDSISYGRILAAGMPAPRIEHLVQSASLYRGPFLDGFSLTGCPEVDSWITQERQVWERRQLETLAALMEAHAAAGAYREAIMTGLHSLKIDDLDEAIHRRLIELYRIIGDRSAALRQYKWCSAVLARELEVKPSPETEAAYRQTLRDGGAVARPPTIAPQRPLANTTSSTTTGRAAALHCLEDSWRAATKGQGRVVLVSGTGGKDTASLIEAFVEHLAPHGKPREDTLILHGAGHDDTRANPYGPLAEALRPIMSSGLSLVSLPECYLAEMTRVLPEVHCLYPGLALPPAGEPAEARTRLFEALYRTIGALIPHTGAAVLCLDDLHAADETTLDWLAYLGRRLAGWRLLVLGAYASEASGRLTGLRRELARAGALEELVLTSPNEVEVADQFR